MLNCGQRGSTTDEYHQEEGKKQSTLPGTFRSGVPGVLALVHNKQAIRENVERCDTCQRYLDDDAAAEALKQAGITLLNPPAANLWTDEEFIERAKEIHQREGEVEIDDGATVSRGDDNGAYVAAWVWVGGPGADE